METLKQQINVVVNGQDRVVLAEQSLEGLLHELELDARMVVVEHNKAIVRRPQLATTKLVEGDTVELVHFVGGG